MTKIIAFHLPQYYSFPENDKWWGEGFTDWCNVKKAKPLFEGHNQPRIPKEGYYNMLDHSVHLRQAELAQKYGIYGFCYYHYWFNGKMLLEKPVEMLLSEPDVTLPFCMCWANEPWTRSWDGKNREVIMPQSYGSKEDWKRHIDYLIPFFMDKRYIRVKGKPLFIIYRTNNINCCDDIIAFWDEECRKAGLNGIYIIEERNNFQSHPVCRNSAATLDFEPNYTRSLEKGFIERAEGKISSVFGKKYTLWSYPKTCDHMIARSPETGNEKTQYLGMFTGWDNSPRRKQGASIAINNTPELFEHYLRMQLKRSEEANLEYLFLNAWNEWAEGAYLEPDTADDFAYLEAVRKAQV